MILLKFLGTLLLGGAGGCIFYAARLPLPWVLGSMVFCAVAAISRLQVQIPQIVRPPVQVIIGLLLGASFTPHVVEGVRSWPWTLLGMLCFIIVGGAASTFYFHRVGGFDRVTAYFSGMPGGMVEMYLAGEARGGDGRLIALVQSARVFLVVLAIPFVAHFFGDYHLGAPPIHTTSLFNTTLPEMLWLVATGLAGILIVRPFRIPAQLLLGPMLASASVHALGWTNAVPPAGIVVAAQLLIGSMVGCRFAGTAPSLVARIILLSAGSTFILLAVAIGFVVALSHAVTYDPIVLLLAYSPGGLTEMGVVALSLGFDVAFVATHHIVRVFIVMSCAPSVFGLLERAMRQEGPADGNS